MQGPGYKIACSIHCAVCGAVGSLPMCLTRLEGRRLLWNCPACTAGNVTKVTRRARRFLTRTLIKAGGTMISSTEVQEFARALPKIDRAVHDELVDT